MRDKLQQHILLAFIMFALVGFTVCSSATESLSFPPFSGGPAGSVVRIPVTGTVTISGIVEVELTYSPTVMRVLGVYGGPFFGFRCSGRFNPTLDSAKGTQAFYRVECGSVQPTTGGPLFEVEVLLLNGPDTTGTIEVSGLRSNGVRITDVAFTSGRVNVEGGNTVGPAPFQGITAVYPNPIASSFNVNYVLDKAGPVQFDLYSSGGRLAYELGTTQCVAGENTIQFNPKLWEISQGAILLRMKSSAGVFYYPVMVVK
jgi:hypothetical protein